jgi:hypothetical protein
VAVYSARKLYIVFFGGLPSVNLPTGDLLTDFGRQLVVNKLTLSDGFVHLVTIFGPQ